MLDGDELVHRRFSEFASVLRAGDLLVLNETRVIAARIFGRRASGGRVELLLLHPSAGGRYDPSQTRWTALAKPARRLHPGDRITFSRGAAVVCGTGEDGVREIDFELDEPLESFLAREGRLPLPPYVHDDSDRLEAGYQTIFAREPGSVAAPTASLHFTQRVLESVRERGVEIARLVLDVGLGTFRPMQTQRVDEHVMHAETFSIPLETARAVDRAKREGRRVVAAGTTVVRALEGSAQKHGSVREGDDATALFIRPGFRFAVVDAMLTNFHLPRSTLLVLVSAFAGSERIARAYREAVRREYRFFSFGDAMFVERA